MTDRPRGEPLEKLATLAADPSLRQAGWADSGSQPLDDRAVDAVRQFLGYGWAIVPTQDGGIQVELHALGCDLEVVFEPDGTVSDVYAEGPPPPEEADAFAMTDTTPLAEQLSERIEELEAVKRALIREVKEAQAAYRALIVERDTLRARLASVRPQQQELDQAFIDQAHADRARVVALRQQVGQLAQQFNFLAAESGVAADRHRQQGQEQSFRPFCAGVQTGFLEAANRVRALLRAEPSPEPKP